MNRKDYELLLLLSADGPSTKMHTDRKRKLIREGMIDEEKNLTEDGLRMAALLRQKVAALKKGIPFSSRSSARPEAILDKKVKWQRFMAARRNGFIDEAKSLIVIGLPDRKMTAERVQSEDFDRKIRQFIDKAATDVCYRAEPIWYQTDGTINGIEVVWLKPIMPGEVFSAVPMQAKYFDFLKKKFRKGKWHIPRDFRWAPIQMRLPSGGVTSKHIIALVAPFDVGVHWKIPDFGQEG